MFIRVCYVCLSSTLFPPPPLLLPLSSPPPLLPSPLSSPPSSSPFPSPPSPPSPLTSPSSPLPPYLPPPPPLPPYLPLLPLSSPSPPPILPLSGLALSGPHAPGLSDEVDGALNSCGGGPRGIPCEVLHFRPCRAAAGKEATGAGSGVGS